MTEEFLYRYVSCQTTPEEEQQILEWLRSDPENERLLARIHRRHDLAALSAPLINELYDRDRRRGVGHLVRRWAVAGLSAAAVVLLLLGGHFYRQNRHLERLASRRIALNVPAGQQLRITLSDGTSVWLNAGTRLEYPALFADGERRVHIDGEARFDVRHDADRPFVVETYACDVRVLGTEFDVAADSLRGSFSTALFEGSVEVRNRQTSETVRLRPDQTVRLEGSRLAVGSIENSDDYLWTEGYINFKGHTFREIIDRYRQVYGVDIRLDGVEVPDTRFQWGKIHIQDGVDNAMKVLQHTYPITYEFDPERRTVIVRNR